MTEKIAISGQIWDVGGDVFYPGVVSIEDEKIVAIEKSKTAPPEIIVPGLIDSHLHIESTLLMPAQYARLAVTHGITAAIADPHEIANVLGVEGIRYLKANAQTVPFKTYFSASSCVPATNFETAGAAIGVDDLEELFREGTAICLGEMMNYPGVINHDPLVMAKIAVAHRYGRPIDGHAPGLTGEKLSRYISAGITTDHEALTREEAQEKILRGMKIILRHGSAAHINDDMLDLISLYPDMLMFGSDDLHPDDLVKESINYLCRRAIARGHNPVSVFKCASLNPARHYGLDTGLLRVGDDADLAVLSDLKNLKTLKTYVKGRLVAENGRCLFDAPAITPINNFLPRRVTMADFAVPLNGAEINVIEVLDGSLCTDRAVHPAPAENGYLCSRPGEDLLKIAVINRYSPTPPAVAMARGFGLKAGAMASSVAHDSHNVIVVGVTDREITEAVNLVAECRGGLAVVGRGLQVILPLPVAGIMTDGEAFTAATGYEAVQRAARNLGCGLAAPFMTLSFLALLVIPRLKLSDRGLFDSENFRFTELFVAPSSGAIDPFRAGKGRQQLF